MEFSFLPTIIRLTPTVFDALALINAVCLSVECYFKFAPGISLITSVYELNAWQYQERNFVKQVV